MNTEFIRLKDISKRTSLSTTTLRRMIKRNELKAVLIGGNYYVRPNDYYEFMFNIECKSLGFKPEAVRQYFKEEMIETVKKDTQLLRTAQLRAKNLIEERIVIFSEMDESEYVIEWTYEEN